VTLRYKSHQQLTNVTHIRHTLPVHALSSIYSNLIKRPKFNQFFKYNNSIEKKKLENLIE